MCFDLCQDPSKLKFHYKSPMKHKERPTKGHRPYDKDHTLIFSSREDSRI